MIKDMRKKLEEKLRAECLRMGDMIPYMLDESGRYRDTENIFWWTNGFWPGMMWQMYSATGDDIFMKAARASGTRLRDALQHPEKLDHDVGFMYLHTALADYRLTGDPRARADALAAADILAARYNPRGGYIQAWNANYGGKKAERLYIVDCMMNIPLLYWADGEGRSGYGQIAVAHADKTLNATLRNDGSSNHIVECDPETGDVISTPAGQGYCEGSSWSRGQSWALYGMALSARYTGDGKYLDAAKRAAHYFLACAAMTGYVPMSDFRATQTPEIYDTTAGMCAACGLLEIADQVADGEKQLYRSGAIKLLEAANSRCCEWDPDKDGITLNGTVSYNSQRNTHIIYGDYFLAEAILRLTGEGFMIW